MTTELIERLRACPERGRNTIEAADKLEAQAQYIRQLEDANTPELMALYAENARLRMDKDVLLGHMDTISNCTNDPAISSLARVVLARFEAQKAGK